MSKIPPSKCAVGTVTWILLTIMPVTLTVAETRLPAHHQHGATGLPKVKQQHTADLDLPPRAALRFRSIDVFTSLPQDDEHWSKLMGESHESRTATLGKIKGHPVTLHFYVAESGGPHAEVVYESKRLRMAELAFNPNDLETLEINRSYRDGTLHLVGAFGSEYMTLNYILYDERSGELSTFSEWGIPTFADLDQDGYDEILLQFEGQHLHPPDVFVLRWKDNQFEAGRVISSVEAAMATPPGPD